jgi:hypothetical protein
VSDPTHAHGLYDPGHAHSIYTVDNYFLTTGGGVTSFNYLAGENPVSFYQPTSYQYIGSGSGAAGTGMGVYGAYTGISIAGAYTGISIAANGSGAGHSHTMDHRVQYVDIIIASKN